jgi:hypothetical protein
MRKCGGGVATQMWRSAAAPPVAPLPGVGSADVGAARDTARRMPPRELGPLFWATDFYHVFPCADPLHIASCMESTAGAVLATWALCVAQKSVSGFSVPPESTTQRERTALLHALLFPHNPHCVDGTGLGACTSDLCPSLSCLSPRRRRHEGCLLHLRPATARSD